MKKLLPFILSIIFLPALAQEFEKYPSASGEINFSSATIINESGNEGGATTRFAPWFNIQFYRNWDKESYGFFTGFTLRNIGFIFKDGNEKWKCRNYAVGIPVGMKWGSMKKMFVYAGYEFEVPFNYRERFFLDDSRERVYNVWFSDRVSRFTHAGFVGINFRHGLNLKLKYYFTEFFNPDFDNSQVTDVRDIHYNGDSVDPLTGEVVPARERLKVNIFYIAVSWNMFRRTKYYYNQEEEVRKAVAIY